MDPKYGEISRAMRNRGVEIFMLGEVGFNIAAYIVSRTSEIIRTWLNTWCNNFEEMVKCSGNKCMSNRRRGTEMTTLKKRFMFFETFF